MKQLLIEVDPETAAQLEKVAPGRSRRRSEFIRSAIRRALWELEERATAEAYARRPDSADDAYIDPVVWEDAGKRGRRRGKPR
jgi:predicted transcriptional regulator